jgi:hypothetical protein
MLNSIIKKAKIKAKIKIAKFKILLKNNRLQIMIKKYVKITKNLYQGKGVRKIYK